MATDPILVSNVDMRERRKRQRELWLAMGAVLFIAVLSWVELRFIGVNSYLFLVLFNFNFILLLIILGIVLRNVVKLVLERRRKVLGSRLRTRMVLSFVSLSLVPTLLMFLVSVKFVQTSVDFWFKAQVENSMEQALEVGQAFYSSSRERLASRAGHVLSEIRSREYAWGGKAMETFMREKAKEYNLSLVGVLTPEGKEQNWIFDKVWKDAWPDARATFNLKRLSEDPVYWSSMLTSRGADMVVGIMPVDGGKTGWLVLGETIGQGLMFKLDQIVRGVDEFKKLRTLKYPLKVALYMSLGVMTALIILASIYFGFRMAKELSAPVQALAVGTQRIARGDLGVRLEDQSDDELGFLVQSFNRMAMDLEQSQDRLKKANIRLGQQNRELEDRGRYMEAVLNNITAGVISLDREGRISTVNKAAQTMLGLDRGEVAGKSPLELLKGEYAELVREVLTQLQTGGPTAQWQRQISIRLAGRDLKYLVNVVLLRSDEGGEAGLVAVFEDVAEMEKMQRMAAWREVARRIAHEIKNPLTPIKLSAQRLERKYAAQIEDPVFRESTGMIVRQVEHLQQMVTEFSSFAKLPEVALKKGRLQPLVNELAAMFRNSHRGIAWEVHVDDELPELRYDPEGMRRVLMNILSNCAEVLEGRPEPKVEIRVSHDKILKLAIIEIGDNGPGLTEEERSRLFEPYFSRKKGGTGLGLTIVRSIITDHNGFVRVRPNKPEGTVMVIELLTQ
jgi:two-component system nitrogen regulation sensor histidine kinase NtrY